MIGIEIKMETSYGKILYDLLKGTNFNAYKWMIIEEEVLYADNYEKKLAPELYGEEWEKEISSNGDYYVRFLNLQVYPTNSKTSTIETYDDFLKSNCELIMLFADKYIEMYMKEGKLKEQILKNIESKKISYEIKTRENDGRYVMRVF